MSGADQLDKEIVKMMIFAIPSFMLLGLGFFGWSTPPSTVDPAVLGDPLFVTSTFIIGGLGALISFGWGIKISYQSAMKKK